MDGELKSFLQEMKADSDRQLHDVMTRIEDHLDKRADQTEERIRTEVREANHGLEVRMGAKLERVETSLLTEIHLWSSVFDSRGRGTRDTVHALELEMDSIKDRLRKLEGGGPAQPEGKR